MANTPDISVLCNDLGICHPLQKSTCIGYGQRKPTCGNPAAAANRAIAVQVLQSIQESIQQGHDVEDDIENLARLLLCERWHGKQYTENSQINEKAKEMLASLRRAQACQARQQFTPITNQQRLDNSRRLDVISRRLAIDSSPPMREISENQRLLEENRRLMEESRRRAEEQQRIMNETLTRTEELLRRLASTPPPTQTPFDAFIRSLEARLDSSRTSSRDSTSIGEDTVRETTVRVQTSTTQESRARTFPTPSLSPSPSPTTPSIPRQETNSTPQSQPTNPRRLSVITPPSTIFTASTTEPSGATSPPTTQIASPPLTPVPSSPTNLSSTSQTSTPDTSLPPTPVSITASPSSSSITAPFTRLSSSRPPRSSDSECCICQEAYTVGAADDAATTPEAIWECTHCQNRTHRECFDEWAASLVASTSHGDDPVITCVHCRATVQQ